MRGQPIEFRVDGRVRTYRLIQPDGARPVSLVMQLHGRGIGAEAFDRWTGLGELAPGRGLAVAVPGALGEVWNDGRWAGQPPERVDDVAFLGRVIDDASERLACSRGRRSSACRTAPRWRRA